MKLKAVISSDVIKPAGEFKDDKGRDIKYDEKRVLTVLELPAVGQETVRHLLEMRIPVSSKVASRESNLAGMIGEFVITEVRPARQNSDQETGIVGYLEKLTGTVQEAALPQK